MGDVVKVLDPEALKLKLVARARGCFLCRWILVDLEANNVITDGTQIGDAASGKPLFPAKAREAHLKLERLL